MIDSGPMANPVFASKHQKILDEDYSAQAPLRLVYKDSRLICDLAKDYGVSLPLFSKHKKLLKKGFENGLGNLDIISIVKELKKNKLIGHRFLIPCSGLLPLTFFERMFYLSFVY
jgi:3-hydroxyisobutyrate dehydrogenase-like beta-hydroxyacid dehydrogenase